MSAELDWDAIYRQCAPSLRRFIRTRVPGALVEDTLQDTFVRAYRSRHRLDPTRPPLPWLLTIARRACFETLRVLPPETPWPSVVTGPSPVSDDPHQLFESRLRRESMARALSELSPRHRRLLLAWELEHDTGYPMLADEEGITTKALKSALCRARSAFRSRYAALAERVGVAAGAALWPARLRARLQRALVNGGPLAEATVGGIAAAIVSMAVVVLVPTPGASGAGRQTLAVSQAPGVAPPASAPSASASPEPVVVGRRAVGHPPAVGTSTATDVGNKPTSQPTATVGAAGIVARGDAELEVDHDASTASITLGVSDPAGGTAFRKETNVHCDGAVRQVVCRIARQTPLAQ